MKEYNNYDIDYPELIIDIINYFRLGNGEPSKKSILEFCTSNRAATHTNKPILYDPQIINRICQRLCERGLMSIIQSDGGLGMKNNYLTAIRDENSFYKNNERNQIYYNSIVYGFEYIYNFYKTMVVPLVWRMENGDYSAGTGFKIYGGIATAKHCITDPRNLSIKGFSVAELQKSKIYFHDNPNLDIAFIDVKRQNERSFYTDSGRVLQEVLTLGYPKIPAFTDFLTAEKATISSKAEARLTPTRGTIAAFGENYFAKTKLMLITAKIRGGNSGGPIINDEGSVVGISCQIPDFEGAYDDLGYGIVVPIQYLNEIVSSNYRSEYAIPDGFFMEFE